MKPRDTSNCEDGEDVVEEDFGRSSLYGDQDALLSESDADGAKDYSKRVEDGLNGRHVREQISNVSFASLLQAQDALSRKRKRESDTTGEQESKLEAVRARLDDIRSRDREKQTNTIGEKRQRVAGETSIKRTLSHNHDEHYESEQDESDSAPSEEDLPSKSRTSKHAPAAQSSKHQVTRKRTVVDVPKRVTRDPRFDALQQLSAHTGNSEKAYSFLRDYQSAEISELKAAIKQTRNEEDKETLKRKVVSMENQLRARQAKDREQEIQRRHRKEEREKVEQGKKPFYLKRKDVKERMLVEKFEGMKSKDREKLMERRRKKESQREKKRMPEARRGAG